MRGDCEKSTPDCKYFPNCFSDTDHIYGHGSKPWEKDFADSPLGQRQICRREHDEINATYVHWDMPDVEFIVAALRSIDYKPKRKATRRLMGSLSVSEATKAAVEAERKGGNGETGTTVESTG